jgi:hypothetical protein
MEFNLGIMDSATRSTPPGPTFTRQGSVVRYHLRPPNLTSALSQLGSDWHRPPGPVRNNVKISVKMRTRRRPRRWVEDRDGLGQIRWSEVCVHPRRDRDVTVAQQLRHPLDPHTRLHQPTSERAPKIVRVQILQLRIARAGIESGLHALDPVASRRQMTHGEFGHQVARNRALARSAWRACSSAGSRSVATRSPRCCIGPAFAAVRCARS